jgi:phosphopantetheinyl transferase (holo-ACP synthase)
MIGNDIVDLAFARQESSWKRKGFFNKIFTSKEQELITSCGYQEIMIWNLWSRKEAAYKIYNRQTRNRTYNPAQFECFDTALEIGSVFFENHVFYTRTTITSDYIYTEAVLNTGVFKKIQAISRPQNIQKEEGIPFYFDESNIKKPLSITNHGRFEKIISLM